MTTHPGKPSSSLIQERYDLGRTTTMAKYPEGREADLIATDGGKHEPLDNVEIERICKCLTKMDRKLDTAPLLCRSNNGMREQKAVQNAN
jgi:hypothetical protein